MKDLIERLERLDGPCRECDVLINANTGGVFHESLTPEEAARIAERFTYKPDEGLFSGAEVETSGADQWNIPAYTGSIDAAMSLVPDGFLWSMYGPVDPQVCVVDPENPQRNSTSNAATPAIALCIASLRSMGDGK